MGFFESFFEVFGIADTSENGPCSDCQHQTGLNCTRFYEESYSRVQGTTKVYDSLEKARGNDGFCGHRGKYWEKYTPPDNSYKPCEPDEDKRGNW